MDEKKSTVIYTVRVLYEMMSKPENTDKSVRNPFGILIASTVIVVAIPDILNILPYTPTKVEAQSPEIDASNVYEAQSMSLGNDIKNLVILIPNEAHESQNTADSTLE